jgi:hypothetical protein
MKIDDEALYFLVYKTGKENKKHWVKRNKTKIVLWITMDRVSTGGKGEDQALFRVF